MFFACTVQFDIFAAGSNTHGKLGINADPAMIAYKASFTKLAIPKQFSSFSLGNGHVVATTTDGELYGWGTNNYNQLLVETKDVVHFISPHLIDWFTKNGKKVRRVDAGSSHTIVLTTTGEIYTFGDNTFGQLGKNVTEVNRTTTTPVKLTFPANKEPVWVTAMDDTSFVRMRDGTVYVFGSCANRICGAPYDKSYIFEPAPMNITFNVTRIYMGYQAVVMVDSNGLTWAIGNNAYGQLCRAETSIREYTAIPNLTNITQVSFGERHTVFLNSGAAIGCGNGDSSQLGEGIKGNHSEPVIISPNTDSISATTRGTIVIKNGKLSVTGNCTMGELGLELKVYTQLTSVPSISGVKNAFSYKDYSFVMQEFAAENTGLAWWIILIIIVAALLFVGGCVWFVIWIIRNKSSLFDISKYKKIDERSALAQNQADLEAW